MIAITPSRPSQWAQSLGYGGLIPFVGLAAATFMQSPAVRGASLLALLAYGATILSFLGAIHWGLAMRDAASQSTGLVVWGVMPSLLAWIAMLLGPVIGLCMIAAGLWVCLLVDQRVYPRFGLRGWLPMRQLLTAVASLSCIAAAARYFMHA